MIEIFNTIAQYIGYTVTVVFLVLLLRFMALVSYRACRDTLTVIMNILDDPEGMEWWRWLLLPILLVQNIWEQAVASLYGYTIQTRRIRK